ncbi:hypothetical protein Clacol_004810 [Clathrus columnatus]|uniref:Glyoxylate reductase n=1 Tax=Clathrus columnatus TaxID=1419009 RepID=A0AAV5ABP3_9AGAM|nr:hypothetical protein Clacol_004810 [Clathrus columnatus]
MSTTSSSTNVESTQDNTSAFYSFEPSSKTSSLLGRIENGMRNTSNTHKILISRDIGEEALQILEQERSDLRVHLQIWSEPNPADRSWLLQNVKGATGLLVTLFEKVDEELLEAAGPSLKVVSTMSVGYDHISLPAVAKRGIVLGYTPDVLTEADDRRIDWYNLVADICIMLALMASRNARIGINLVQNGEWPKAPWSPFLFCGPQLSATSVPSGTQPSKVAGFLGFGRIAQATVRRLEAFGLKNFIYSTSNSPNLNTEPESKVLDFSQSSQIPVSLATLAAHSDVLFILAPHNSSTHHIISKDFLKRMKTTAVLVNASRGALVDSDALATALKEGQIFAAGLDVVEGEPFVLQDHPLIREQNCVIIPHIGSATTETRVAMATLAARNLLQGLLGEPLEAGVDLSKYT